MNRFSIFLVFIVSVLLICGGLLLIYHNYGKTTSSGVQKTPTIHITQQAPINDQQKPPLNTPNVAQP